MTVNLTHSRSAAKLPLKCGEARTPAKDGCEERRASECSKVINAPKGIGIHEQNIFQIICKSPDYMKDNNPYLMELYRHRLDEKNHEAS